ncbi:hypothetical protein IT781_01095 [Methylobacter sp. BlB1]|nr:hypothetical protein [Methylobacter sp. BlB1]
MRSRIVSKRPVVVLEGEVECDEVYGGAGHKGQPEAVKKGRKGRRNRLKGARGRGTLDNVQQATIQPVISKAS